MGETEGRSGSIGILRGKGNGTRKAFDPSFLLWLPNKLQDCIKSQLNKLAKDSEGENLLRKDNGSSASATVTALGIDLEKQLQVWRQNPVWADQPPQIKVSVPRGSLCNLSAKVDIGLPPDAVYNIVTDPDNRRVFKNIKEVKSRRVLLDDGHRQVVDVEQAAIWKFLWWSGTISVHVLVDQNRQDHSMNFKQLKTEFMKRFEGCWKVEPIFVDEAICYPFKPKTLAEYCSCTGGKGRLGSKVSLEQLIQPEIVPPPPISWYLRGITARTTEMIVNDLVAETGRIRVGFDAEKCEDRSLYGEKQHDKPSEIKERWALHRRNAKKHRRKLRSSLVSSNS